MSSEESVVIPRKKFKRVPLEEVTPDTPLWMVYHQGKEVPFTFGDKTRTVKVGKPERFDSFEELQAFAEFVEQHPDFVLISGNQQDPIDTPTVEMVGNYVKYTTQGIGVPEPYTHVALLKNIHHRLWVHQLPWEPIPPEYRHWLKEPLYAGSPEHVLPSTGPVQKRPFSRTDPAYVRQVVEKLLPDATARRLVLELIAECIRESAREPQTWGVTLHGSEVCLNVGGGYYGAWVRTQRTALYFLPVPGDEALSTIHPFKQFPDVKMAQIAVGNLEEWVPKLYPSILDFVRQATAPGYLLPARSRASHSPGVLRYIEDELGLEEPLPDPIYPPSTGPVDLPNYWAFQANPSIYDVTSALAEQQEDTWRVDNSDVRVGDRIIIWKALGGEDTRGIVGLAEVVEGPTVRRPMNMQYFRRSYTDEELLKNRVVVRYVHSDRLPVWKEDLPESLRDLSVAGGVQGNVFKVLPDQWEALMEFIGGWPEPEEDGADEIRTPLPDVALNRILYGPPGTGKTFSTISAAVEVIDGYKPQTMEQAKARWDELRTSGQIEFVTFHQSYGYEDFVEGIRPVMDDSASETPRYEVKSGILKSAALRALQEMLEPKAPTGSTKTQVPFAVLWQAFADEWADDPERTYPGLTDATLFRLEISPNGGVRAWNTKNSEFKSVYNVSRKTLDKVYTALREDYDQITTTQVHTVIGSNGHHILTACLFRELKQIESRLRGTDRLITVANEVNEESVKDFLEKGQQSGYRLASQTNKRFVLVIDEINRGNISKVFGELITLIEDDKRIGGGLDFTVTLPYSREAFGLPNNLYVIGTMNTADKSIALVDVALRRRFEFEELMPDFSVCTGLEAEMRQVLSELNRRIILRKDRDHQIGHAFFIRVQNQSDFNRSFGKKVIPLLQEFFYGDWDGLRFVLGEEDSTAGRLIIPIVGAQELKGARNRWQWYRDAGNPLDVLEALKRNYRIGTSPAQLIDSNSALEDDEPNLTAVV